MIVFKKIALSVFCFIVLNLQVCAKEVIIFSTNDIHGRLEPFNYGSFKNVGGASRRSAIFKAEENPLILDAGDFAQGTLYFKILENNLNLEILDKLGYHAIALGNHEFDKGVNYIKKSALSSKVPLLVSNVKFLDEEINLLVKRYVIKEVNDVNIAIIGVLDCAVKAISSTNPDEYFVYDEIETLQEIVDEVDVKSDLIIVLSHCGVEKDKKIAKEVKGIDLIIGGHSHTFLKKPIKIKQKNGDIVLISQNGEFGKDVGKWHLDVDGDKIKKYKFKQVLINDKLKEDEQIKNLILVNKAKIETFSNEVAGYSETLIDARREVVKSQLTTSGVLLHSAIKKYHPDVEISFNTSGGYRYGGFLPQTITNKDVVELFPFESYLVILDIKGSDIEEILETSSRFLPNPAYSFLQSYGISYDVDLKKQSKVLNGTLDKILKKGNRVSNILINNKPLDKNKYYRVATDSFMYFGGDGYVEFKKYKKVFHTYMSLDKILIKYLNENSPVKIEVKDNINIIK